MIRSSPADWAGQLRILCSAPEIEFALSCDLYWNFWKENQGLNLKRTLKRKYEIMSKTKLGWKGPRYDPVQCSVYSVLWERLREFLLRTTGRDNNGREPEVF